MFIFSTEEFTLAAMRKGRDGQRLFFSFAIQRFDRCCRHDDVPECRGRDYVLCVLLDALCCDIQRVAQGSEEDGLIFG